MAQAQEADRADETPRLDAGAVDRVRNRRRTVWTWAALALLSLLVPAALQVAGFIRLQALGAWSEPDPIPYAGEQALERAVAALAALSPDTVALAAAATQEGHWRLVNRRQEAVIAASPEEIVRALGILLPQAPPSPPLTLLVTPESIIDRRAALQDLPKAASVRVVVGGESYAVLGRGKGAADPLVIEMRPNVLVEAASADAVREALWQLDRPIENAKVRILALEAGGPSTLTPAPRKEPGSRRAMIDVIDPASLKPAMGSVRGQTLVVTGRVEAGVLYVLPANGGEHGLLVRDLFAAAAGADVNLVILQSSATPRQPGGRNWLWQRVEVKGLDEGLKRPRLADLVDAVGGDSTRFMVRIAHDDPRRTLLDLSPARGLPRSAGPAVSEIFLDAIGGLTGRVVAMRLQASVRSAARQREIDKRILPFMPATAQLVYAALLLLGLAGMPVARRWWTRIWPHEDAAEYPSAAGYHAARLVRGAVFVTAFLPVAAPAAAPLAIAQRLRRLGRAG